MRSGWTSRDFMCIQGQTTILFENLENNRGTSPIIAKKIVENGV